MPRSRPRREPARLLPLLLPPVVALAAALAGCEAAPRDDGSTVGDDALSEARAAGAEAGPDGSPDAAPALEPPPPPPAAWRSLIGEYVRNADTVSLREEGARLHYRAPDGARRDARLRSDTALAVGGMDRPVRLVRGGDGTVRELVAGGRSFRRLAPGGRDGAGFRIDPVRPVDELRAAALAASPPSEAGDFRPPDLVEPTALDSTIRLDVRYATENNFMGARFYRSPRAFLQRPAAEAVVRAHRWLKSQGYGLLIYDAYRPWHVTKMFWDATPDSLKAFVADPAAGSRHNRGAAVDLSLYDLDTGEPVAMPSGYDEFTPRAAADYAGGTQRRRWYRSLLRLAMEAQGFTVYPAEWWHFDHREWREYGIADAPFEELSAGR